MVWWIYGVVILRSQRCGVVAWWSPSLFTPLISVLPTKITSYKKPFPTLHAVCLVDIPLPRLPPTFEVERQIQIH